MTLTAHPRFTAHALGSTLLLLVATRREVRSGGTMATIATHTQFVVHRTPILRDAFFMTLHACRAVLMRVVIDDKHRDADRLTCQQSIWIVI